MAQVGDRVRLPSAAPGADPTAEHRTVVIGENNGSKCSVLDALRLLTDPLDGRRDRYGDVNDLCCAPDVTAATLTADSQFTDPEQLGTCSQGALPSSVDGAPPGHVRYFCDSTTLVGLGRAPV